MSKISQLHAELTEQAAELGFESIEEAEANGYEVDYEKGKLVKRGLGYSETVEYLAKEQEKAHEAWLEEKACVLEGLEDLRKKIPYDWTTTIDVLDRAIKFIKEQCHD